MTTIKGIIWYVNRTSDFGIWYSRDLNDCSAGYSDADWAGSVDDRKSISRGYFYRGNNLMSWLSKKQNSVSLSTAEVEYITAGSCCAQLLWMKKLLHDYGISQDTMCIFYDNTSAINLSMSLVQHSKSKHIEIRYHFICDLMEEKVVFLEFIHTKNQYADIFTKPLDGSQFESLRKTIGVGIIPWLLLFGMTLACLTSIHSYRRVHSFHHVMFLLIASYLKVCLFVVNLTLLLCFVWVKKFKIT